MKDIPFYASPGGGACLQATLRMAMEYFEPRRGWTWPLLYEYTDKEEGKGTLPLRMCVNLVKDGYDVVMFDDMNLEKLSTDPITYYKEKYSGEVLDYTLKQINPEIVKRSAQDFKIEADSRGNLKYFQKDFSLENMEQYLKDGYLIMPCHNSNFLSYRNGYTCHILIIFDMDDEFFYAHDPAWLNEGQSVATKNKKIPKQHMFNACKIDNGKDALYAIRKKETA